MFNSWHPPSSPCTLGKGASLFSGYPPCLLLKGKREENRCAILGRYLKKDCHPMGVVVGSLFGGALGFSSCFLFKGGGNAFKLRVSLSMFCFFFFFLFLKLILGGTPHLRQQDGKFDDDAFLKATLAWKPLQNSMRENLTFLKTTLSGSHLSTNMRARFRMFSRVAPAKRGRFGLWFQRSGFVGPGAVPGSFFWSWKSSRGRGPDSSPTRACTTFPA